MYNHPEQAKAITLQPHEQTDLYIHFGNIPAGAAVPAPEATCLLYPGLAAMLVAKKGKGLIRKILRR